MRGYKRKGKKKKEPSRVKKFYGRILYVLSTSDKPLSLKELYSKIQQEDKKQQEDIVYYLRILLTEKKVFENKRNDYQINPKLLIVGEIDSTQRGGAYFVSNELENDIFIKGENLNTAFHKDTVLCLVYTNLREKETAVVLEVKKRDREFYVGKVEIVKDKNFAFVIPDNKRISNHFFVHKDNIKGAKEGQKVLVKIKEWEDASKNPYGEIVEILGDEGEHNTEIHSILAEFGLPYKFPKEVEKSAKNIPKNISKEEIFKRKDYRDILTFTIDPFDAKDFDDALSYEDLGNEKYRVGIHIADVSHYVKPNTILDKEAVERATSVYLVDRVVPMLPEILSNKVCSLRPNEEKLTFSVIIDIDKKGKISNEWIGKTVINSNRRFTYEEAQKIIETKEGDYSDAILKLDEIAKVLKNKRMENGSISFESEEVKFILDENNEPKDVYFKIQKDANHLIEEFMLVANQTVAKKIGDTKNAKTFVYRIHDKPNDLKLNELSNLVKKLGYSTEIKGKETASKNINELFKEIEGKSDANMIQTLAIRTMSKAEYSTQNIGHYGLGFKFYSHFTSPIRRYPDILVHRMLEKYLIEKGKSENTEEIEYLCEYSSKRERVAVEAERESIKYMQAKYMDKMIGKEFKGIISGITDWGIFVELVDNKCEGFIKFKGLNTSYQVNREGYSIFIGKGEYRLGDEVKIEVENVDISLKQINFSLIL